MLKIWGFGEYFYLQWHINSACNLHCAHCYVKDKKEEIETAALFMVLDKYENFLRLIKRKGRIQFTGGEPFLSPHLMPLLSESARRGIPTRILSNGTLITPQVARELKQYNCHIVQVSLEGDEEHHDALRGPGSYRLALKGAASLKAEGISVTFMMTVFQDNAGCLTSLYDTARHYGDRFSASRLVPIGEGRELGKMLLSPGQTKSLFTGFYNLRTRSSLEMPMRDPLWRAFFKQDNPCLLGGCSVGYNGICVDADGAVYPCRRLPLILGNILDKDFTELWEVEVMHQLRDRDLLQGRCGRCSLKWQCGGCRAIACAVTGSPLGEDVQCFLF